MNDHSIRICSFNCKNVKTSVCEINEICNNFDVIMLQETWLLDFELPMLNDIHPDFYARGITTMKAESGIVQGRPHGGLAVLWRKCIGPMCTIVDLNDDRLLGFEIANCDMKLFFYHCVFTILL